MALAAVAGGLAAALWWPQRAWQALHSWVPPGLLCHSSDWMALQDAQWPAELDAQSQFEVTLRPLGSVPAQSVQPGAQCVCVRACVLAQLHGRVHACAPLSTCWSEHKAAGDTCLLRQTLTFVRPA